MHAANLCWLPRGWADLAGEGQMASSVAVRISSILIGMSSILMWISMYAHFNSKKIINKYSTLDRDVYV